MRALGTLTAVELKLFLREPSAWFWTLLFPVVLVVVIGAIPSSREFTPVFGQRGIDYYTPILLIMAFALLGLYITPTYLVGYREKGILRRLSTTPVGPARVLVAQLAVQLATAVVTTVLVLGLAALLWDVPLPAHPGGFLISFTLTVSALLSLGLLLAAVVGTSKAATSAGGLLFFPMMLFAGLYVPRDALPPLLGAIGDHTPVGAAVAAFGADGLPGVRPVLVLAVSTVVFGLAAHRLFRWE